MSRHLTNVSTELHTLQVTSIYILQLEFQTHSLTTSRPGTWTMRNNGFGIGFDTTLKFGGLIHDRAMMSIVDCENLAAVL
jgi:hypothetical protein